jgi:succinate dehydrogenase / fumarate reductase, cytochrome b subunit
VRPLERTSNGTEPRLWQFILYRLFSLSGIVPIGGYLIVHLTTNVSVINGAYTFQKNVDLIHSLGVLLPIAEWGFIFLPLIFHALVGLLIISGAVVNVGAYPLQGNIRYTLQRVTGVIALAFIFWHVIHLHHLGALIDKKNLGQFDPHHAASSAATAINSNLLITLFYAVGVIAIGYHFANGLWTFGLRWGIWTSVKAMRRASMICLLVGIGIISEGLVALYSFNRLNIEEARQIETRSYNQLKEVLGQEGIKKLDEKTGDKETGKQ